MQFSSDSNAVTSSSGQTASLRSSPIESILPTATPSIAGTKRGPVPKRRFQKGTFVKRRGNWVRMWRVDTIQPDGTIKREQRSQTFLGLSERAARAKFQPILDAVNAANHATPPVPKTSDTVAKAGSEWRKARGDVAQTKYPTFGGVSPTKAHLAFAWWVPAGGFDGQADANLRHNTSVRAENGKDDRKRLADALLDPWCSPEVGLQTADGSNL